MLIKEYSDFSFTQAGVLSTSNWGVYLKLDNDIRQLFPYINSEIEDARYYDSPDYIVFKLDGVHCTLYPVEVMAAPFTDQDQALAFADRLIGYLNDLYARRETVKPDHRKYKPVPVLDLYKLVPGTNCGECGFTTCMAFAAALSQSETAVDNCPYFSKPISENVIYPVFDKDGNLASTVSIETDASNKEPKKSIQKDKVPLKITSTGVQAELTHREVEVLRLVAGGSTNMEISDRLSISPHTVKSHVVHIFNKLGVNDRTQAAVWASKNNIL